MPKKKTIPPPDDFSSEFMETESAKELSEQQVEAAGSDNTETPLAGFPEVDLGSGDVSGTADVEENELDAENTADAAETVPVSDEKAEDPEYDSILQELNSSTPAPLDSSGENALDCQKGRRDRRSHFRCGVLHHRFGRQRDRHGQRKVCNR